MTDILTQIHPHLKTTLEAYRKARRQTDTPPQVAVAGMLKAGKSSLLNALCHPDEPFAVGAVRQTVVVQRHHHGGIDWIDTPGIDTREENDLLETWHGLANTDLFLFVHSLEIGALEKQEIQFLDDIRRRLPAVRGRLLPVWSQMDQVSGEAERIASALQRSLEKALGGRTLPPAVVSAKRHQTGRRKNKPLLVEKSGIPDLRARIIDHAARIAADTRVQRLRALWQQLDEAAQEAIAERRREFQALSQRRWEQERALRDDLDHFSEQMKARIERFERQYC